jgi:hypothetical protein
MRHGSTLLELTMALTVLALALTVTLESTIQVHSFAGMSARQTDLDEHCDRITRAFQEDLGSTAWFVGWSQRAKRQERLFPRVVASGKNRLGDELQFLRLRCERILGSSVGDHRIDTVDFANDPPTPMARFARAPGIRSLILNPDWKANSAGRPFAGPTWETIAPTVGFADTRDPALLRQFRYVVRPDLETTGRGILFREYRDGNDGAWVTDERIADHLVSLTFSTNREVPSLNPNQIQAAVTLQADDLATGKPRVRRHLLLVVAMRCGFSE